MTEMRSPQGEVLDIPAEGEHAMLALGWVPTSADPDPATPPKKTPARPPAARRRK